jgi:hypothetical protein
MDVALISVDYHNFLLTLYSSREHGGLGQQGVLLGGPLVSRATLVHHTRMFVFDHVPALFDGVAPWEVLTKLCVKGLAGCDDAMHIVLI